MNPPVGASVELMTVALRPKPWGHETVFAGGENGYVGKLLTIAVGQSLSLQYHREKDETLVILSGAAVLEHVIKGKGNEIGFGAITEIKLYEAKGLKFVGPLPAEIQNYTSYEAVMMTGATSVDAARAVLRYLATPAA
ncbi:MAG: hypothetical protein L6311_09240, partial [Cellulomonas sp.]|nr:hypothetical protein [Cellulomonas sp.]